MRISDWSSDVCSSDLVGHDHIKAAWLQGKFIQAFNIAPHEANIGKVKGIRVERAVLLRDRKLLVSNIDADPIADWNYQLRQHVDNTPQAATAKIGRGQGEENGGKQVETQGGGDTGNKK